MKSRVFVLVPVHNNLRYTRACLFLLRAQVDVDLRVIIIDDGSTDGTRTCIPEEFPEVTLLSGTGELWWTGAMVMACKFLKEQLGEEDFIMTLNNDTEFEPDLIARLASTSRLCGRAIVAARCVAVGSGRELNVAGRIFWSQARRVYNGDEGVDRTECFDFLTSRAVLYPAEVFDVLGGFNSGQLPHYHADMEFTYRAGKSGFGLVVDWDACVRAHETKDTSGDHFCEKAYMSWRDAWNVLTSSRSMFYPPPMFRCIDLCCPPEYRFRNKVSFLLGAVSASFGKTRAGAVFLGAYRRLRSSLTRIGASS